MKLEQCIDVAKKYLGEEFFVGLDIAYCLVDNPDTLLITRNDKNVKIEYGQLASLFRGLTLIKEKRSQKHYSFTFHRIFKTDGLMLDCSRNGVMKNEKVKEMILLEALMGSNRLLMYTEDTYQLDNHPYFGYLRGSYTKGDIQEFVDYGESFGIELVPCIQTLGHMYQALKWGPLHHFKDGEDNLLVDYPETYIFIEDMVSFCRDCFKSKEIHVGMDESTEMGLKRYLRLYGYKDRVAMFSRHLKKVMAICQKHDFLPMIWSDMFFRLNSQDEEYYIKTPLPDSTLKLVPPDVKLVYWDYYHDDYLTYLNMIKFHKQTNNPIVFAGGSWRWKGHTPAIETSMDFTEKALRACINEKVDEVFITAWGDNGSECSFFSALPVMVQASIFNFIGSNSEEDVNSLLVALTDETLADFKTMDLPDQPAKKRLSPAYNPSKFLLYQDLMLGIFDCQVKEGFSKNYAEFAEILRKNGKKSKRYAYVYDNLANLCKFLSYKADLGIKIRKAYREDNKAELAKSLVTISMARESLNAFHQSVKNQWMIECRMFGYEVLDGRLGFLKNRMISAAESINAYLNGNINKIEELEKDILPYDGIDDEIQCNNWYRIVSPSD